MYPFNVRVYGLLINEHREVLITDEELHGMTFSKFPGGGLLYGEGLIEGLKREFLEECNLEVEVGNHFYTTDIFVKSAFDESQVIAVYYLVKPLTELTFVCRNGLYVVDNQHDNNHAFRWVNIERISVADVTFPADQKVAELLKVFSRTV